MKPIKLIKSNGVLWNSAGFRIEIQKVKGLYNRFVKINDLNPEKQIVGSFSRFDTFRIGLFFIWRSIFAKEPGP